MRDRARTGWIIGAVAGGLLTLAPICGLMGTVVGLARAFYGVSNVDASRKSQELAEGISQAMNATAFAIVTAVIGVPIFAVCLFMALRKSRP